MVHSSIFSEEIFCRINVNRVVRKNELLRWLDKNAKTTDFGHNLVQKDAEKISQGAHIDYYRGGQNVSQIWASPIQMQFFLWEIFLRINVNRVVRKNELLRWLDKNAKTTDFGHNSVQKHAVTNSQGAQTALNLEWVHTVKGIGMLWFTAQFPPKRPLAAQTTYWELNYFEPQKYFWAL